MNGCNSSTELFSVIQQHGGTLDPGNTCFFLFGLVGQVEVVDPFHSNKSRLNRFPSSKSQYYHRTTDLV